MKKHIFFIILGIFFTTALNAQFYNDSARSTAMNGAHSAASLDAFEGMMYNPAGLAASQSRFGLHIMGTLGMNLYSNSFNLTTAVEIMEQLQAGNGDIEGFVSDMRKQNLHTGIQTGFTMNYNLFKFFFKTKYFSLGFSDTLKMRARMFLGDDLFSTVFDKVDINGNQSLGTIGADLMAYNDFCTTFSMYLWMLERKTPFRGFYVGGGVHWYTPIVHASANFSGKLGKGGLSKIDSIEQADTSLYTYDLELDGKVSLASPASLAWGNFGIEPFTKFSNGIGIPFGLGFDLGLIIDFNKWIRAGFSVTDLGFMMSPSTDFEINKDIKLDLQDMGSVGSEFSGIGEEFLSGGKGTTEAVLAPLAMRLGATVTPYSNRFIDLECPLNFTVTDFDLIPLGFLPTFGFATGVEFTLKLGFFHLPLWTSIGYFTSSGISVGFGGGLHLGVCHLDLGVRGLESLMAPASDSAWGRDVAFAMQLSFQLGKKQEEKAKKSKLKKSRRRAAKVSTKSVEVIEINVDTNSVTTETILTEEEVQEPNAEQPEQTEQADTNDTSTEEPQAEPVADNENQADEQPEEKIQLMQ